MAPKICYKKHDVEKENETTADVTYDVHDNKQCYQKKKCTKGVEKRCCTKYKTGAARHRSASRSSAGRAASKSRRSRSSAERATSESRRSRSASHGKASDKDKSRSPTKSGGGGGASASRSSNSDRGRRSKKSAPKSKKLSPIERSAKCYDVKRGKKGEPCDRETIWQSGKYVRDECGSGIVAQRFDFEPSRKMWCKTPLTMYQATIGELARKILCREKIVPRDVKPAPPCNIAEYILPPCRGYYRKYDCLRPCEEEHAFYRGGKKYYRDRVERYWEPCYMKDQKIKLDINEYAPQNAFLAKKMQRFNMQTGSTNLPCW